MDSNQRKFFIGLGIFQTVFLAVMLSWMFWDAYKAIISIAHQPLTQFLREPILWHKAGELFLALPIGIAIAAFYMLWHPSLRVRFLKIATPSLVIGGVLNLMAAWDYSQQPTTDFSRFMSYFGFVLFFFGVLFPFVLKWVHEKRMKVENKTAS